MHKLTEALDFIHLDNFEKMRTAMYETIDRLKNELIHLDTELASKESLIIMYQRSQSDAL